MGRWGNGGQRVSSMRHTAVVSLSSLRPTLFTPLAVSLPRRSSLHEPTRDFFYSGSTWGVAVSHAATPENPGFR